MKTKQQILLGADFGGSCSEALQKVYKHCLPELIFLAKNIFCTPCVFFQQFTLNFKI